MKPIKFGLQGSGAWGEVKLDIVGVAKEGTVYCFKVLLALLSLA